MCASLPPSTPTTHMNHSHEKEKNTTIGLKETIKNDPKEEKI